MVLLVSGISLVFVFLRGTFLCKNGTTKLDSKSPTEHGKQSNHSFPLRPDHQRADKNPPPIAPASKAYSGSGEAEHDTKRYQNTFLQDAHAGDDSSGGMNKEPY